MNSTHPRVSVFLPTFNQRLFVRDAIESVLVQGYPNLEIVIGDDGSTDGTPLILQEYKNRHPQSIRLLLSPKNEGITANCNNILRACTGEYVAIFAGDDVWLPGKLHTQVEMMQANPDAAICFTRVEWFDSATQAQIKIYPTDTTVDVTAMSVLRAAAYIAGSGPSLLVRSCAIPEGGFEPTLPMVSDWLLYIEILRKGGVVFSERVLARYRRHAANTSAKPAIIFREHIQTMDLVRSRYPDMRTDVSEYMEHYLRSNVPAVLRGPNGGALKLYCLYVLVKNIPLVTLFRLLLGRATKLLARA